MFQRRRLWVATLIIAVAVIGGFVLSVPRAREIPESSGSATATSSIPVVTLRDSFASGVHSITGSLMAPDVCASLTASASIEGPSAQTGERIILALTMPEDLQLCLQIPTKLTFSVSVEAPAEVPIDVFVNDVSATTSVI
ncbi:MAG: hypothetical protein Q8P36_01815 [bacterium]|nr:hypothetical protein [bacterium]